jgi:hypothetical protein
LPSIGRRKPNGPENIFKLFVNWRHPRSSAKQDAAARLEGTIADLRKKQEAAEKRLPELRSASTRAWGEVKAGIDKAMEDLRKAYENAKSHLE